MLKCFGYKENTSNFNTSFLEINYNDIASLLWIVRSMLEYNTSINKVILLIFSNFLNLFFLIVLERFLIFLITDNKIIDLKELKKYNSILKKVTVHKEIK